MNMKDVGRLKVKGKTVDFDGGSRGIKERVLS